MLSRREFIASVLAGTMNLDDDYEVELRFPAESLDGLKKHLLASKHEFETKERFEVVVCAYYKWQLICKEVITANQYKSFDEYDLWPDPGHIKYKKAHVVRLALERFYNRFREYRVRHDYPIKDYQFRIKLIIKEG
jgi:hypothetical protein